MTMTLVPEMKYCVLPGDASNTLKSWSVPIIRAVDDISNVDVAKLTRIMINAWEIVTFLKRQGEYIAFRYKNDIVLWNVRFIDHFVQAERMFRRPDVGSA